MTDAGVFPSAAPSPSTSPSGPATAGRLLREARERQGLHIAALAASIKVTPKKLEMLEADRLDALPDATFSRALAQTVCRALKIDPAPIMALLPPAGGHRLEQVGEGLNAPFRNRPGAAVNRNGPATPIGPIFWITGLILVAALAIYFLPAGLTGLSIRGRAASAPAAAASAVTSGAATAAGTTTTVVEIVRRGETPGMPPDSALAETSGATAATLAAVPPVSVSEAAATVASVPAAATAGLLQVATAGDSWLEVSDARGQPLVSRLLKAGESIGVDGTPPLKVRIGNASGTRVTFRGQSVELAAFTRDNVARLELR